MANIPLLDVVGLVFSATGILLMTDLLRRVTAIAAAPHTWKRLSAGVGLVVTSFAVRALGRLTGSRTGAAHAAGAVLLAVGFVLLFAGTYDLWEVVSG